MLWILALLALALCFYYFLIKPQYYWRDKNVLQGPPIPILGDNMGVLLRRVSMTDMVKNKYMKFKNARYVGMYQTTVPTLLIRDLELIKQITVKDFDHFVDHRQFLSEAADSVWTRNLIALRGEPWREMRATLSPAFTTSKMRAMFTLMEQSAKQYVKFYLDQNKKTIDLDLKDSFTRFANDVIANCAFGVEVDSLKDPENQFYTNGFEVVDISSFRKNLILMLNVLVPKFTAYFKLTPFPEYTTNFFKSLLKDVLAIRKKENLVRPDMINLLIEASKGRLKHEEDTRTAKDSGFATVEESDIGRKEGNTRSIELSENDMTAQVLIFFFAGFETISTMMSFMCYELAINPDIQVKLRDEVDKTYSCCNGQLTYELLNKMKYMDMVVSECLRKHTVGTTLDRICTKPYTIKPTQPDESPVHLQPGDNLWISVVGIHYDEKYFPNPNKFDPERFSDQNKGNINPYAYIPFGVGPRNCIGSRFALMEIKVLMFHVIAKFELTVIEKTSIPFKLSAKHFNPYMEGGFWVGLKKREFV